MSAMKIIDEHLWRNFSLCMWATCLFKALYVSEGGIVKSLYMGIPQRLHLAAVKQQLKCCL